MKDAKYKDLDPKLTPSQRQRVGKITAMGSLNVARQANGQIAITWTGAGVLQAGAKLPSGWSDVSPAPTGNTYTVTPAAQTQQYFRLRQ